MRKVTLYVNGREHYLELPLSERLLDTLRHRLLLTGTKEGCGEGECGACTVLVDGKVMNSCLLLTVQVQGQNIETIEGVGGKALSVIQKAFIEKGAVQCGFCTPGFIMSTKALLDKNPAPGEEDIRQALSGNLCRCTGYVQIIEAVKEAARQTGR